MKGFYIENFALRLIFCVVGMFILWFGMQFIMDTFVRHEEFRIRALDILVPLVAGVAESFTWKPKN